MTNRLDLEARVTQFLQGDAPTDVPERLIHSTRDQVAATRQHRAVDVFDVRRAGVFQTLLAASGILGVAAVAAVLLLSNQGESIGARSTPNPIATVSTAPSPTSTASQASKVPPSACTADALTCLSPGTYSSIGFSPKVSYTVPAGWIRMEDNRGQLDLQFAAGGQYTYPDGTTFHDAISIFRRPVAESATSRTPLAGVGTKADALAQWLAGHKDLVASAPGRVTVAGVTAFRLVNSLPTGPRTAPDHCTTDHGEPRCESLFLSSDPAATYGFGLVGPETAVVYLLDLPSGDTVMVVGVVVDGIDQPGLVAAATPVVESLAFSP
jgi:hypothetical protein